MEKVWILRDISYETEVRVFHSKENAFKACQKIVKEYFEILSRDCSEYLNDLNISYNNYADKDGFFGCGGLCWCTLEEIED